MDDPWSTETCCKAMNTSMYDMSLDKGTITEHNAASIDIIGAMK